MRPSTILAVMLLSACSLFAAGAVSSAPPANPDHDFSTRPFRGGNTDWTIRLVRIAPGQVAYTLHFTSRAVMDDGLLVSVKPEIRGLGLKGRYGLASADANRAGAAGPAPRMQVLVAPSAEGTPCKDRRGATHPHAILLFVGNNLLYGCGDYGD